MVIDLKGGIPQPPGVIHLKLVDRFQVDILKVQDPIDFLLLQVLLATYHLLVLEVHRLVTQMKMIGILMLDNLIMILGLVTILIIEVIFLIMSLFITKVQLECLVMNIMIIQLVLVPNLLFLDHQEYLLVLVSNILFLDHQECLILAMTSDIAKMYTQNLLVRYMLEYLRRAIIRYMNLGILD